MKNTRYFLLAAAMLFSLTANSATPGWYAGLGFVNSSFDHGVSDWNDGSLITGSVDDSDTGLSVFFGNRISDNLAIEFGHIDLGEASFKGTSSGGLLWLAGNVASNIEISGFQISALGIAPVSNNMEFFVKAGLFMWEADVSATNLILPGTYSGSEDDNDLFLGFGLQYNFRNQGALRIGWEDYGDFDLEIDTSALILSYSVKL